MRCVHMKKAEKRGILKVKPGFGQIMWNKSKIDCQLK